MRVCLASGSPRRLDLLASIGIVPEVRIPSIPEEFVSGESPREFVRRLAVEKGETVLRALEPGGWFVVAADTVVVLDGDVLGKPGTEECAVAMLEKLSGREHRVLTGMALFNTVTGARSLTCTQTAVPFRNLDSAFLRYYVSLDKVTDCAGAYRIQGRGVSLLGDGIRGSYSNVVGLPLETLFREAERLGVDLFKT